MGLIFIVLLVISVSYDKTFLTKVIVEIWRCKGVATTKSNRAKNTSINKMRQVINKRTQQKLNQNAVRR